MTRMDFTDATVDGIVTLSFLMESQHNPLPEGVEILREFRGIMDFTYVRRSDGHPLSAGIHTLIKGDLEKVSQWLDSNSPVWVGVGSPMIERFKRWTGPALELEDWELEELYFHDWPKERKTTGLRRFGQWFVNHFKVEGHPDLFHMTNNEQAYAYCQKNFLVD